MSGEGITAAQRALTGKPWGLNFYKRDRSLQGVQGWEVGLEDLDLMSRSKGLDVDKEARGGGDGASTTSTTMSAVEPLYTRGNLARYDKVVLAWLL